MTDGITIRRVGLEFLRPGPSHHQGVEPTLSSNQRQDAAPADI
jgi:hypothetical protein